MFTNKHYNIHKVKYERQVKTYGGYNEKDQQVSNGSPRRKIKIIRKNGYIFQRANIQLFKI